MSYVRKLLASCLLVGVSLVAAPAAKAGSAAAADESMPEAAYAPLDAVAIMLDTGQALLFDETENKYRTVMVGDLIAGWKVVAIEESRVLVLHDDQRDALALVAPPRTIESVRLPQTVVRVSKNGPVVVDCDPAPAVAAAPPAPAAPVARAKPPAPPEDPSAPHRLSRGDLNRELSDFDRLGAAVDVVQAQSGGFRLVRVDKASWPYRMGLREGDVIRSVAGERVANIEDAARVYARLRQARTFTVEVDRPIPGIVDDGDPPASRVVLNYHVK
jgi:hypothetical protein